MELKFSAQVTLSEPEIRGLIVAELARRYPDVKVVSVNYNIDPSGYLGGYNGGAIAIAGVNQLGHVQIAPTYSLRGAVVIVEKK